MVCLRSVYQSVTFMAWQKRLNRSRFRLNCWRPRDYVLHGVQMTHQKGQFRGRKGSTLCKYRKTLPWAVQNYQPIEMLFGLLSWVEPINHCVRCAWRRHDGKGYFTALSRPLQNIRFPGIGKRMSCAKMSGPVLTICTSYDKILHKKVPFWGRDVTAPHLWSEIQHKQNLHIGSEYAF